MDFTSEQVVWIRDWLDKIEVNPALEIMRFRQELFYLNSERKDEDESVSFKVKD